MKTTRLTLILFLLCVVVPMEANSQIESELHEQTGETSESKAKGASDGFKLGEKLDAFLREEKKKGFSGEFLIEHEGVLIFNKAYGRSGCDGEPVRKEGVYLVGSLVKDYTKLAIYNLADQGLLSLDDSVRVHLTELPTTMQDITLRMLTQHRAGLPDAIDHESRPVEYSTDWDYLLVTKSELLRRARNVVLIYAPGTDQRYSNLGYSLLAAVIESSSGLGYEEYVHKEIFNPLQMNSTGYVKPNRSEEQVIDGCRRGSPWPMPSPGAGWLDDGPSWNLRGNGGMLGTVGDIKKWLTILEVDTVLSAPMKDNWRSAVVGTSRAFQQQAIAAGGSNGVYNAYYLRLLDSDFTLIMVSNNSEFAAEGYKRELFELVRDYLDQIRSFNN